METNNIFDTAGICGVYCKSCTLYIGSKYDPKRLEFLASRLNLTVEDLYCEGCRSDKKSILCRNCTFIKCAKEKNVKFCSECSEFKCNEIIAFQIEKPHRAELWDSCRIQKEETIEFWEQQMTALYKCPECSTINSAYDLKCRNCSNTPSNKFTEIHSDLILKHLSK